MPPVHFDFEQGLDHEHNLGHELDLEQERDPRPYPVEGARASVVNRTRRVIRDQALALREQRSKSRSLWLPLAISSSLMLIICYAVWYLLDGYDMTPNGVPDASDQLMLLVLWSLPVTLVLLGLIWFQRSRRSSYEVMR